MADDAGFAEGGEFAVREVVWDDGRDASTLFDITFTPVPGKASHRRMFVRYRGGLQKPFRGRIVLTTPRNDGPSLPIALVVFDISP